MSDNSLLTKKILEPLSTNNGAGEWLRYSPTYVKIRDAKREEDDGMSREAWEGEIKHANWQEVERLTLDALESQSKDLQLICWLIEARLNLYSLEVFSEDIGLLSTFIKAFWENGYPTKEEDSNQEFRVHILESFLKATTQKIIATPFDEPSSILGTPISLAQCYESDNAERASKKGGDAAKYYQNSLANGLVTIERVKNAFSEVQKEKGEAKKITITSCIKNLKDIDSFINQETRNNGPNFDRIIGHLEEMERLYNLCQKAPSKQENKEEEKREISLEQNISDEKISPDQKIINDRTEAYMAIRQLGDFLLTLEPHSPSPALLKLIGGWEEKTLPQILKELQSTQPELRSLLELLAKAPQQKGEALSTQFNSTDTSALSNLAPK